MTLRNAGLVLLLLLTGMTSPALHSDGLFAQAPAPAAVDTPFGTPPLGEQTLDDARVEGRGWQGVVDESMGAVNTVIGAVFFWDVLFWDAEHRLPLLVLWLVVGAIFFTFRMGFINFRAFGHAIQVTRGKYTDPDGPGEVSHFQALTTALSATVGLGNIAGVAIAVSLGGPGATFWMILAGLLGMSSKFTECTLGQQYREIRPDGKIMGGAMYYLSKGLGEMGMPRLGKALAVMFAVLCIGGSFGGGNSFQVNQSLNALQQTIPFLAEVPWAYGLFMTVLVGIVIIGGIRRIASVAERIVPLMCILYVLGALVIILDNAAAIPAAFASIFTEAFAPDAIYGGFIGALVVGFQRAAFSNEAGIGSAAIAHAAARTKYPVREGIVALLEPFIDTVVVCTMTALVIIVTGAYNNPAYSDLITANQGAALTSRAMGEHIAWFPYVLSLAVFLFAFSTMISWSYYGERCWSWLFGDERSGIYKGIF
ncbi:MAG: alanine:cation symporter family protein, partial [Gemmatimonadota bacterium]|nr:alanine:cation symporter family protein [Gemmatimonadota bacterium]